MRGMLLRVALLAAGLSGLAGHRVPRRSTKPQGLGPVGVGLGLGLGLGPAAAGAFENAYPVELNTEVDGVMKTGKEAARAAAMARARAAEAGPQRIYGETEKLIIRRETAAPSASDLGPTLDLLGAHLGAADLAGGLLWGVALFLGIPSPLLFVGITEGSDVRFAHKLELALARALGNEDEWVKDRAAGFKSEAPFAYTAAVGALCLPVGFVLGQGVAAAVGGDSGWSASLGTCAAIAAGALEVGRPLRLTRQEQEARDQLWEDFEAFAGMRLQRKSGGVHISNVIKAFRGSNIRYVGSNRASDSDIEEAARAWYREGLSQAGFMKGVVLLTEQEGFERANSRLREIEEGRRSA
uniref:Uncharacterized protein n=1 Tax=Phaeomonas parva TaxID=124430 RepID=A0A7S1UE00_9STRA|mmetsp:Transcript_40551/g.126827  ORF Transcript_40551/g.126827 Transcript_40551/m.126827 type:complete len:354 (+) Transcript_40551:285-1346(+)|eukprot:CAMPEP_0118877224 /NCGR_PEP_ID=MMETSP1163-20130328/17600_1 /TAXON_ID=124430 /ORGANISM="Phaeomonas parva, Strain CCMP2877" /LENGTH=353 /DNA_ID=CAMNT_0006812917 /DNA_START=247 /DNA_END=1308 /DNA_ORIENTATION=+